MSKHLGANLFSRNTLQHKELEILIGISKQQAMVDYKQFTI